MQNSIQVFESSEFGKLEVLMIDGKPYFPGNECAKILGYAKPFNAVDRHCRYTLKRGTPHPQSPDKTIEVIFIPEGDLYRLIIRSKLPSALEFEKWVFDKVLPTIRKHGAYIQEDVIEKMKNDKTFADELLRRLTQEQQKTKSLETQIRQAAPKVRYHDIILQSPKPVQVSIIAKDYGMSAVKFNQVLRRLGVQFKVGKTWLLYSKYAGKGYTISNTYIVDGRIASVHTLFTQKGRRFLYDLLAQHEIYPESEQPVQMEFDETCAGK